MQWCVLAPRCETALRYGRVHLTDRFIGYLQSFPWCVLPWHCEGVQNGFDGSWTVHKYDAFGRSLEYVTFAWTETEQVFAYCVESYRQAEAQAQMIDRMGRALVGAGEVA